MILEMDLEQYTRLQDDGCPNCPEQIAGVVITYPSGWQYHTDMTAVLVDLPITHQDFVFTSSEILFIPRTNIVWHG